ncbi:hypothetical protein CgunFtcFv8_027273 [Champsocephalus gunnari]|uniref:Uncharacterized protein n=1 Tax=Champsocephalus gunnari TaxID=52237 RepID=A0AAN8E3V6_CHAGU|nr:hypothetical protein CgunFtcFv8_027273 [Champsocephalus gunnari]
MYRSSTHTPPQADRAQKAKSGCDIICRKRSQTTFSLLSVSEVGASRSASGRGRGSRGARRGQISWSCPAGSLKSRAPTPESSLKLPTTFLRCRIEASTQLLPAIFT